MDLVPKVEILEQPAKKYRFRYPSEGRNQSRSSSRGVNNSGSTLLGVNSKAGQQTYPTIKIVNCSGKVTVAVTCVTTEDNPYRLHSHALLGKNCDKGVYHLPPSDVSREHIICFQDLRIQCFRKDEKPIRIEERKKRFQNIQREHYIQFEDILKPPIFEKEDRHSMRLCFKVSILSGHQLHQLPSIFSDPINNSAKPDEELHIHEILDNCSPESGGKKIIILCNKISKDDIRVRFFEVLEGVEIDVGNGEIVRIHRKTAIICKTPKYELGNIDHARNVFIELVRPPDRSNRIDFQYVPDATNIEASMKRKRDKIAHLQTLAQQPQQQSIHEPPAQYLFYEDELYRELLFLEQQEQSKSLQEQQIQHLQGQTFQTSHVHQQPLKDQLIQQQFLRGEQPYSGQQQIFQVQEEQQQPFQGQQIQQSYLGLEVDQHIYQEPFQGQPLQVHQQFIQLEQTQTQPGLQEQQRIRQGIQVQRQVFPYNQPGIYLPPQEIILDPLM